MAVAEQSLRNLRPWARGQSGNRDGRPRLLYRKMLRAARQAGPQAVQTLREIMADGTAPPSARIAAATALLDRGFGKPREHIELAGESGGAAMLQIQIVNPESHESETVIINGQLHPEPIALQFDHDPPKDSDE